jgi:outer membrane protein with beta-barrel domain
MPPCRLVRAVCWLLCALPAGVAAQVGADSVQVPAVVHDTVARSARPRKAVGAQVGFSRSDLRGADAEQLGSREAALTGVYLLLPVSGWLSVRPEVLFALKGGRTDAQVRSGASTPSDLELAYLEIPLLLRANTTHGSIRPLVFGGLAPALNIGCDVQSTDPSIGGETRKSCADAGIQSVRSVDVGFVAGAGVEFRWPQSALALEARYTGGLQSVISGFDVKNRQIGVLLALTF